MKTNRVCWPFAINLLHSFHQNAVTILRGRRAILPARVANSVLCEIQHLLLFLFGYPDDNSFYPPTPILQGSTHRFDTHRYSVRVTDWVAPVRALEPLQTCSYLYSSNRHLFASASFWLPETNRGQVQKSWCLSTVSFVSFWKNKKQERW